MKLSVGHVAETLEPVFCSLHRTISASCATNLYRALRTFELVSIGTDQSLEEGHSIARHDSTPLNFRTE
jgi:hypothetical protein